MFTSTRHVYKPPMGADVVRLKQRSRQVGWEVQEPTDVASASRRRAQTASPRDGTLLLYIRRRGGLAIFLAQGAKLIWSPYIFLKPTKVRYKSSDKFKRQPAGPVRPWSVVFRKSITQWFATQRNTFFGNSFFVRILELSFF